MIRGDGCQGHLPQVYRIDGVYQETPRVKRFVLDRPLECGPGQFVMAWLPGIDEKPFSVMDSDPLTLAVARVGPHTDALHRLGLGGRVWIRGPFGQGFRIVSQHLLLIAGGYGAAPLYFLAKRAREAGRRVSVVVGAQTADELALAPHFAALGCEVTTCTDDGSDGRCMLADEAAAAVLDAQPCDGIYACGPEGMMVAVEILARMRRLPVQLSREAYMRCGFGVCGSCSCGDQLVCRDGPVFSIEPGASGESGI